MWSLFFNQSYLVSIFHLSQHNCFNSSYVAISFGKFVNEPHHVEKIEALKTPNFTTKSEFKTLPPPIIIRLKEKIMVRLKFVILLLQINFLKELKPIW